MGNTVKSIENGSKPTLILTIGLPRSGKSTWALSTGWPIVNPDSIRLAFHGQSFVKESEPMIWTITKYMVRSLFLTGHKVVILDATNTLSHNRGDWNSKEWNTIYKCFLTDINECKRRALANKQEYLISVIDKMYRQLEWPNKESQIYDEKIIKFLLEGNTHG